MDNSFLSKVEQIKEEYYDKNGKNIVFKKSQKNECAKEISANFDLNVLIRNTTYIIPNTNKVYFNYEIFKLYANSDNYQDIYNYLLYLIDICIDNYQNFEIHMNSKSFTISACERYKTFVLLLTQECLKKRGNYSILLDKFYVYFTPNSISNIIQICSPFIDSLVKPKFILYDKKESEELLQNFLHH